ncbi:hypothetical protein [Paenibacillus sp. QZ-Y1]|uniref:hypothetical protein n=1 Tax=Paenibacillus sp. QZ-Y1 TaxID=3414511 RepID=UPI003F7A1572
MEKKRVIQLGKRVEQVVTEENRRTMEMSKKELTTQRPSIHNLGNKDMNRPLDSQQNIWKSRLLSSGARNQPWFDKLQDYRNEV